MLVVLLILLVFVPYNRAFRPLCIRPIRFTPTPSTLTVTGLPHSNNNEGVDQQYQQWVKEEEDLQRAATEERVASLRADGSVIPEYMLQMLNEFGHTDTEPTHEGQLPIIAVIGRPNTGKSTIVNKLTDSYKVRQCIHRCILPSCHQACTFV